MERRSVMNRLGIFLILVTTLLLMPGNVSSQETITPLFVISGAGGEPLDWSPDGQRLLTMRYRGGAYIVDVNNGEVVHHLDDPDIIDGSWDHQGSRIASLDWNGSMVGGNTTRIWDATTGENTVTVKTNYLAGASIWSFDDQWLLVDAMGMVDPRTGYLVLDLDGFLLAWSLDGQQILACDSDDDLVRVWDVETRSAVFTYRASDLSCWPVRWGSDRSRLLLEVENRLEVWDVDTNRMESAFDVDGYYPQWSYDGTLIATHDDYNAYIWRVSDGERLVH